MRRQLAVMMTLMIAVALGAMAQAQRVVTFGQPRMKVFLPPESLNTGSAVVILPGGGYSMVALGHEGYAWVPWFNCQGLTVAVVDYTLPEGNPEKPMTDVREAFEILADSASAWGLDPTRIGIMGSSAGGHLASTMATHPAGRCRPAFQILFYPVISLGIDITHGGTRQGFIGPSANQRLVEEYSSENKVTPQTPPAIMLLSADDQIVSPDNSIRYFQALTSNGVPASLMIYPSGGHGWGYNPDFKYFNQMLDDLGCWIRQLTPSGQINQTYAK